MPFGLSNAPGVFQELMMKAISQLKLDPETRMLLNRGLAMKSGVGPKRLHSGDAKDLPKAKYKG